MPTPRHRRAFTGRRRTATITSVLAGAVAAGLAAFLVTAPTAGASNTTRSTTEAADTGSAAYTSAIKQLAITAIAEDLGISTEEAAERLEQQDSRTQTAIKVQAALGDRVAGTWISQTNGALMVGVTDEDDADAVEAAGGTAQVVRYSMDELETVQTQLDATSEIPGTSWAIDPASNSVTVLVSDSAAADSRADAWLETLAGYGDTVQVQRTTGDYTTQQFFGGQAILSEDESARCSAGFNATDGQDAFVITAGHCTAAIDTWTDGEQLVGDSDVAEFPGDDFGTIAVDDADALDPQAAVIDDDEAQPINGDELVPVGSTVCKTGSTTGTTCGTVEAYDTTVVYPEGQVRGLTQTDVCTQAGDSGGALFAGDQAQGLVSGGTAGDCDTVGFVSFFQPIDEVLEATGLQLLVADNGGDDDGDAGDDAGGDEE